MIYTITFYDANGNVVSQATFNVPDPDDFVGCLTQAVKSGYVPGAVSVSFEPCDG